MSSEEKIDVTPQTAPEITPEVLQKALLNASPTDRIKIERLVAELNKRKKREEAQEDFLAFVRSQWPDFISGAHHRRIAKLFEAVARGEKRRIIINLAPRHTKSEFASFLFPAWFLGKFPKKKVMQVSNTAELAEGFGRKVRNLLETEEYKEIFPDVELRSDSKAAGRWNTNYGGDYYATGVGAALAGRGADLCIAEGSIVYCKRRGPVVAGNVSIGDYILGSDGYGRVEAVIHSTHTESVFVDGAEFSKQHPIWTVNRGWVAAGELTSSDWLQSVKWYDRLSALLTKRWYYATYNQATEIASNLLFQRILHLVGYAAEMFQSQCSKLQQLWSQRYSSLRTLEQIYQLYSRYGVSPITKAHAGSDRQYGALHTGELPVGVYGGAVQQQAEQRSHYSVWGNAHISPVGAEDRLDQRHDKAPDIQDEAFPGRGPTNGKRELEPEKSATALFDWRIGSRIRITRHYGEGYRILQKEGASRLERVVQNILRVCLGIRRPRKVKTVTHTGARFVNFMVGGHHTFIVNPYLTHNCIIDDPHSENEALQAQFNPGVYDKVYDWFTTGPRQRLQPGGAIIIVQTRWSLRDLTGQILETASQRAGADQWEVFEFPAILPSGNPLWPEYWSREMLEAIRAEIPTGKWQAQYQQDPTSDENAIIKRADWQVWDKEDPPRVNYVIMAMDTAFEAKKSADYSAAVFFGVWDNPEDGDQPNIILLNAWRDKLEFPELKARTLEMYKEWEPDSVIIEKKASGAPLIAELRRTGIPVQEYTPSRGNDKITRLNSIADIFASGKVWAPRKRWAEELIDEVASFPSGRYDDFVDCVSLALSRFRAGGFVGTQHDKNDYEDEWMYRGRTAKYY